MKYLYPAQQKRICFFRYTTLVVIALFSYCLSFSQANVFTNASVDLVSFTARSNGAGKVTLNIVTDTEINMSHFVIERSYDGKQFEDVAIIFMEEDNTSSQPRYYNYTNNTEKGDSIFYRLRMVNGKGEAKYSAVAGTTFPNFLATINPRQSLIRLTIPRPWAGQAVCYMIYDASDRLVKEETKDMASQRDTLNILDLPIGRYTIKAVHGTDSVEQKIIKLIS